MRWLGLLAVIAATGAGVYFVRPDLIERAWARSRTASRTDEQPRPAPARSARKIFAAGTVEGIQRDIPLRFEVAGRLKEIHVQEGDHVQQGDVLAQLDAEVWEHKLAEANARVRLARAERDRLVNGASQQAREVLRAEVRAAEVLVREAEVLLARGRALEKRSAISTQEADDYRFKYEKAAAQLQAARARCDEIEAAVRRDDLDVAEAKVALADSAVKQDRAMLEKTRIRAPTNAVVLHVLAEPGELVGPNDDRDLFTLVNRERTRVRAYVEELDALNVEPGQAVYVTADGKAGKKYDGVVRSCSPYVRPKTLRHQKPGELIDVRVREVIIELAEGADLVIGLPVDVFIVPGGSRSGTSAAEPVEGTSAEPSETVQKSKTTPARSGDETNKSRAKGGAAGAPRVSALKPPAEIDP
jgi:multidrug resistance efflux pump